MSIFIVVAIFIDLFDFLYGHFYGACELWKITNKVEWGFGVNQYGITFLFEDIKMSFWNVPFAGKNNLEVKDISEVSDSKKEKNTFSW